MEYAAWWNWRCDVSPLEQTLNSWENGREWNESFKVWNIAASGSNTETYELKCLATLAISRLDYTNKRILTD